MSQSHCSRRDALQAAALLLVTTMLPGCGGDSAPVTAPAESVTRSGNVLTVRLDRIPALQQPDSAAVLGEHQVIVLRLAGSDYRAFSNVCTHSGCGIQLFRNRRMICQCHGSEFDLDGRNVAGPAPSPLQSHPVTVDDAAGVLRIQLPG